MFRQVSDLANMLRPVATALDLGQSDKTTIADACNIFMNLLNEPVLQNHRDKVQKKFDFLITLCHLVAYMFHPKYLGAGLTLEQIETVKKWLICKDEAFSQQPLLSSRSNPFSSFLVHHQRPGQQPSDMGCWAHHHRYPRWLHRLNGDATVCSGIICSSGASLQWLWAGTHQAPRQARTPESCKVDVHL